MPPLQPDPRATPRSRNPTATKSFLNPDHVYGPPDYSSLPISNHHLIPTTSSKNSPPTHPDASGFEEVSLDTPPSFFSATPTPTPPDDGNTAPGNAPPSNAPPSNAPPNNTTLGTPPPQPRHRNRKDPKSLKQKAAEEDPDFELVERVDASHSSWNASADHPRKYPEFEKAGRKPGTVKLIFGDGEGAGGSGGNGQDDCGVKGKDDSDDKDQDAGGREEGRGKAYDDASWGDVAKELIVRGGRGLWERGGEVGMGVLDWVGGWR